MSFLQQDSAALSDVDTSLLLDEFGGMVESQFAKASVLRQFVPVYRVTGTDTLVNNRVGRTQLQKLIPGVRPDPKQTGFGKAQVTIDTVVLARDSRSMLNELQVHFSARAALAEDQGKELGKFFDQAFIIQAIKGAGQSAPTGLNGAFGAGKSVTLSLAGDESDPDKLYNAIASVIVQMEEEDIDVSEIVIMVSPTRFDILLRNDKLVRSDYSEGNANYAQGEIYKLKGARIVKTARIPSAAITGHYLSNALNSNAYDVTATEAKTVAVILHPKSLLAGETIPLTSDIFYDKTDKTWYIDSFLAFGVNVNRPDVCGRVLKQ